jgi:hypothetical protein
MKTKLSAGILLLGTLVLSADLPPRKPISYQVSFGDRNYVFELSEANIGDSNWDDSIPGGGPASGECADP